jgi:cell division protein FtsB
LSQLGQTIQPSDVVFNLTKFSNTISVGIDKYQVDLLKSANKKVGVAEKAVLQKHTEYVDLVAEIKHLNKEIHDLREKHSAVEKK